MNVLLILIFVSSQKQLFLHVMLVVNTGRRGQWGRGCNILENVFDPDCLLLAEEGSYTSMEGSYQIATEFIIQRETESENSFCCAQRETILPKKRDFYWRVDGERRFPYSLTASTAHLTVWGTREGSLRATSLSDTGWCCYTGDNSSLRTVLLSHLLDKKLYYSHHQR